MSDTTVPIRRRTSNAPSLRRPAWWGPKAIEPAFVLITLAAIALSLIADRAGWPRQAISALGVTAYLAGGYFGARAGLASLKQRQLNIDFLMVIAALGAAAVGEWRDGAILLFLFSLSNILQDYAIGRSRRAIRALFALHPEEAHIRRGAAVETVPVSELALDQVVLIRPGERIPVDGEIVAGASSVDQSPITGESMPVEKGIGDKVFAGTLNQQGALDVRVTQLAQDSTLARIIRMVEEAQGRKAPTQRFLDDFEQYYALAVIGAALLVMLVPWLALGWSPHDSFYRAMVLLVVASPCALVISVPAAYLSAIAAGARRGVIFKGGVHLEQMAEIKVVAFDKTGTLTAGAPAVTDIHAFNGYGEDDLLRAAATVEARSEHPLSQAVRQAAEDRNLALGEVEDFAADTGRGVTGVVDGAIVRVGNCRYVEECAGRPPDDLLAVHDRLEAEGKTVLLVCNGDGWMGALAVADRIRPQAATIVDELHAAGIERVVMLTGDNPTVGRAIGQQAHIDQVHAGLMPADKAAIMEQLEREVGPVAMVGDGINDAPALAAATVGIAMGAAGTDVALETADVVLMGDKLEAIPYAIQLSRRARRVVWQNIAFALAVIVVLVLGAFVVNLPLPVGVIGHEGSTVIVVLNGLRLLTGWVR